VGLDRRKRGSSFLFALPLIALSIGLAAIPTAQMAMEKLQNLSGCEVHLTNVPTPEGEAGLKRLGVDRTSAPHFSSRDLLQP
jgi:uncharacterized protein (UPF0371 family)